MHLLFSLYTNVEDLSDEFVDFLLAYKDDPECPAFLRNIITAGFLRPAPGRLSRLASLFRHPMVEGIIKGPLKIKLMEYDLDLTPIETVHESQGELPTADPRVPSQPANPLASVQGQQGKTTSTSASRRPLTAAERRLAAAPTPDKFVDMQSSWPNSQVPQAMGSDDGSQSAAPGASSDSRHRNPATQETSQSSKPGRVTKTPKRDGPEWRVDSLYKDTRQPPLGLRLEHVLNFLREEDVDRCRGWKEKVAEVTDYLDWLREGDADRQLDKCGPEARDMHAEAVKLLKVHEIFERIHYAPTKMDFEAIQQPRPPPRLYSGPMTPKMVTTIRVDAPVHTMVSPGKEFWSHMRADEHSFWAEDDNASDVNLFLEENAVFEDLVARRTGWIVVDPETGTTSLPGNGPVLQPGDARSLAQERGARRAGLQMMLRSFGALEHELVLTPWRVPSLPVEPVQILRARYEVAKNLIWTPFRLQETQMPLVIETMPYNFWWNVHFSTLRRVREHARIKATNNHGNERGWVCLPRNVECGGPFIWRRVDAHVEAAQDLASQCEVVWKLMQEGEKRRTHGGGILKEINKTVAAAIEGRVDGRVSGLRNSTVDEIKWLRFLAADGTNKNMTRPLEEKGKLFNVFALRVQKVLHDRAPGSWVQQLDAKLTVEKLLEIINSGSEGPAQKTQFTVRDAMCWLPRLHRQGRLS
jgi:hypothetical protein